MQNKNCENCRFSVENNTNWKGDLFCRRNPPTLHMEHGSYPIGIHPIVFSNQWCGEWQSDMEQLNE